jgi:hypothetical protein
VPTLKLRITAIPFLPDSLGVMPVLPLYEVFGITVEGKKYKKYN